MTKILALNSPCLLDKRHELVLSFAVQLLSAVLLSPTVLASVEVELATCRILVIWVSVTIFKRLLALVALNSCLTKSCGDIQPALGIKSPP